MESTRALFFDEVRKGPRLVNYLGHAGTRSLGFVEELFRIEDLETMTIDGTQPLFSTMSCTSSRFEVPGLVSLGEAMLLDDEAAIAVWGPSGVSINAQATLLARALVNELSTGGETRIGPMINRAFPVLADLEFGREMISIYICSATPHCVSPKRTSRARVAQAVMAARAEAPGPAASEAIAAPMVAEEEGLVVRSAGRCPAHLPFPFCCY